MLRDGPVLNFGDKVYVPPKQPVSEETQRVHTLIAAIDRLADAAYDVGVESVHNSIGYEDRETQKEIAESDARLALYEILGIESYFGTYSGKENQTRAR